MMIGKLTIPQRRICQEFKIEGSQSPIPFDDLESTRTTFIEMKNGIKKVEKGNWRAVSRQEKRLDQQWRGRTVFRSNEGVPLREDSLKICLLSSRQVRSNDL